jgi:hypothetical protein
MNDEKFVFPPIPQKTAEKDYGSPNDGNSNT